MKRHHHGFTLIEVLLAVMVLALILTLIVPQLLKYTHEQAVDKTVAEMNQIVLTARNYYQDTRSTSVGLLNKDYWPQTLGDLSSKSYLPAAALCSSWPALSTSAACKNHQPYVLFPSDASGKYDTSVPGITGTGLNGGGNFWGVSLTLANAEIAEEVRQKLPFATRCAVDKLKSGNPCLPSDQGATVTALVPRPAIWPILNAKYSNDGLIQSMGSILVCSNDTSTSCSAVSGSTPLNNKVTIPMPSTCNTGTPVLFVYPFGFTVASANAKKIYAYPGVKLLTTANYSAGSWTVTAFPSGNDATIKFNTLFYKLYLAYFTACAPNGGTTNADPNKWDPSNFPGD